MLAIRHGETAWNVEGRIQGQLDVPLNDTGRWQVHRLALAVADEGISAVYSSDLLRALETAQAVARGCDRPITTDVGLRERGFGIFEGLSYDEINRRWPEQARAGASATPTSAPRAARRCASSRSAPSTPSRGWPHCTRARRSRSCRTAA